MERCRNRQKSCSQQKKWRAAREFVIRSFQEVVGGIREVASLSKADVLAYRQWLGDQITGGSLEAATANKRIGELAAMVRKATRFTSSECPTSFRGLRFEGAVARSRNPFPRNFVQEVLFQDGFLDGLNDEAEGIVLLIADTGVRIAEACSLDEKTIDLTHEVPHIRITSRNDESRKYQLKTTHSARVIPLVGTALEAMKRFPSGFPRYANDGAASVSALVNKYLRRRLDLGELQTFYSLRHTFGGQVEERRHYKSRPHKLRPWA